MQPPAYPKQPEYLPEEKIVKFRFSISSFLIEQEGKTLNSFMENLQERINKLSKNCPEIMQSKLIDNGSHWEEDDYGYEFEISYTLTEEERLDNIHKNKILSLKYDHEMSLYKQERKKYNEYVSKLQKEKSEKKKKEQENNLKLENVKKTMKEYILNEKFFQDNPDKAVESNGRYRYFLKLKTFWDSL